MAENDAIYQGRNSDLFSDCFDENILEEKLQEQIATEFEINKTQK